MSKSALVIVDVQNDFCPGGSMAVAGGDQIISPINTLLQNKAGPQRSLFQKVVATADWHPPHHVSFAQEHEGHSEYEVVEADGLQQNLWPVHCLAGSEGAALHPELDQRYLDLILHKGTQVGLDSYSAFFENDGTTSTGLHGYLQEFEINQVYIVGLALDWCVYFTALDARRLGYMTILMEDLSRPVDVPTGFAEQRLAALREKRVIIESSSETYYE
ncbi:MAG TPA: bifunctional nicotinamidase/pyrazinamidase [Clostridia bacterium]|nr:bifunctional nicotinamidase/pyrazinamidase [Clostridia bacterium]